jgi:adenosylcobinamide-GDP ribazoletransferase
MSDHSAQDGGPDASQRTGWRADLATVAGFFTILPIAGGPAPLAGAAWAFPVVGAAIGLAGGVIALLALAVGLGPGLAAVLAAIAVAVLTGALHEDGLADAADGLGARGGREARLAAMRDTSIGAFGVLALVLVVAGRLAALAELGATEGAMIGALVAAGALSRAGLALILQGVAPARADGLGHGAGAPSPEAALIAAVIAAVLAWVAVGLVAALAALIVAGLACFAVALLARHLFGGHTGDVLGAAQQITELAVLIAVVAVR